MVGQKKPIGLGTLSLLVLALGFAFNFSWGAEKFQISHYLFHQLNLPIYSNGHQGLHFPFMAAAIFWIPAVIIAGKYRSHYGTSVAFNVAAFMLLLCIIGPVVDIVDRFVNA